MAKQKFIDDFAAISKRTRRINAVYNFAIRLAIWQKSESKIFKVWLPLMKNSLIRWTKCIWLNTIISGSACKKRSRKNFHKCVLQLVAVFWNKAVVLIQNHGWTVLIAIFTELQPIFLFLFSHYWNAFRHNDLRKTAIERLQSKNFSYYINFFQKALIWLLVRLAPYVSLDKNAMKSLGNGRTGESPDFWT